jgi:hypothetical protein
MGDEQCFTEDEVNAILARAVDLERTGISSPEVGKSLSLTELKAIAEEAGIGPALVEVAAADFLARRPSGASIWLGPPPRTIATRLLDPALSPHDVELLMRLVEERSGRRGMVTEAFERVRWVSQDAQLTTEVSIGHQIGKTRIDVEGSYPPQMRFLLQLIPGAIALTATVSVAAPAGLLGAPLVALALGGGALGSVLGRGIWELAARATSRAIRTLADELAAAATELGDSPPMPDKEVE